MLDGAVPASRNLASISIAEVDGTSVVMFDTERLTYHTLNRVAFSLWQQCDGFLTVEEIRLLLKNQGIQVSTESVECGVLELMEAGLLEQDQTIGSAARINRIAALKFLAATVAGGVVLPAISSITAPVIAETSGQCAGAGYPGPPCGTIGYCASQNCTDFCFNNGLGNCAQCDNVSGDASDGGCCNCFATPPGHSFCPCFS